MLKSIFLAPGRLLARLFRRDRRRAYRSARSRSGAGPGMVILSLIAWLALAGLVLYTVDKAGLLKQALDAGVDVATSPEPDNVPPTPPPVSENTSSAGGSLKAASQNGYIPPVNTEVRNAQPAVENEMWLVILHSIPKSSRAEAERLQSQYKSKGLEVDILDTDAYPRLKAGNWIVALGPFDDRASALVVANEAKSFRSGLMVRRGL